MNALLASSIIDGSITNQQITNGSSTSVLLSSIEFSVSEVIKNSIPEKSMIALLGKEELYNGQNKTKVCDPNKNSIEKYASVNGKTETLSINGSSEKSSLISRTEKSIISSNIEKSTMNGSVEKSAINGNTEKSEDTIPVPKVELYTGKIHVEWNQVYKIGAGLNNLGNTCFMNTVIQCLTYCPPLANYLLHDNDHASKCRITGFCMMCLLQRHMKKAIGKTGEVIRPTEITQRLKLIVKHFTYGRQEDAHEFLRYVIDHLWRACLPQANGVIKLDPASKETTVINKIFGGYHRSQVICLRCKKESNTFDHFMDFILDIKQNVPTLEKALERFIQPELLQQENSYKCPRCKAKVEAHKRFSVYRPPNVATFQLKRFDYNRSYGGKIMKHISYPEKLNMRPYMSEPQGEPVWYRLNAVLVHAGQTCNSGHYYCYVKNSNDSWYIMDDQRVQPVSLTQVLAQIAYVLFYIKVDTEKAPLKKPIENKSSVMKGSVSSPHYPKVAEITNSLPMPLSEKSSPFSSVKTYSSSPPSSIKKFNLTSPKQNKISFGFRNSSPSSPLTPPKNNRTVSPEPVPASHGGLVPYIEDSSDSSDASDTSLVDKPNSIPENKSILKSHLSNVSSESCKSPRLEIRAKPSKAVAGTPCRSLPMGSPSTPKVNATGSWIVTDVTQTPVSSSSSSGVSSTTDWQVIDASNLKPSSSPKENRKDSVDSLKASVHKMSTPRHTVNVTEISGSLSSVKKLNGYEDSPQQSNFRKQIHKGKSFPEDEAGTSFKRKSMDSYSKTSKDSYYVNSTSQYSPAYKKTKYSENASYLNSESDSRNSGSYVSSSSTSFQQRQNSFNCDKNARTAFVNGNLNSEDKTGISPQKQSNSLHRSVERGHESLEKDFISSKGKLDIYHSESSKSYQYEKEKQSISNRSKSTSSLYGTEVPTWRGENYHRPSLSTGHEVRRSFDDYDNEFDRGKVRKLKVKDRYQHFQQKNPFQKHADRYYNNKYNGKFYNSHNYRKYDSRHSWKSSHNNGYPRYRSHHRHY